MLEEWHNLCSLVLTVSWVLVYILMIRRGFLDRSFGIPIIALCLNISWEFNFTFLTDIQTSFRIMNGFYFFFDLGVLYTCFRFGRDDFDWPVLKKFFHPIFFFCLALSLASTIFFVRAFDDTYGALLASIIAPLYSALLVAMLLRRNSVRGQSLYIGLLILIGDSSGYIPTLYAHHQGWISTPLLWIHTSVISALILHILYIAFYCYIAKRDGVSLWKRL